MQDHRKQIIAKAFKDSIPVMMGYLTMGFAGGVLLAVKVNLPCAPLWGAVMAVTILSGTMQFAIVPAMMAGDSVLSVALLTLAINFRYLFYGFSLIERWRKVPFLRKALLISALSDETYALESVATYKDDRDHLLYCSALSAMDVFYWFVGVTGGAIVGTAFTIPSKGIEFAMVALFLVILTEQMRGFFGRRS